MKKVSVIVPIHNCEQYLNYSVKSIIDQTYENLEIFLMENASTDKSIEICDEYAKQYANVTTYHLDMPDLSNARNKGLEVATGDYVALIDGDDYVCPTYLEEMVKILEDNDADIVECKLQRIPFGENYQKVLDEANEKMTKDIVVLTNKEALQKLYSTNIDEYVNKVIVSNNLYRKSIFDEIRYPVGRIHEDEATTYKTIYEANKLVEYNKKIYGYIRNENSIMNKSFNTRRVDNAYMAFEEAINFFKEHNEEYLESRARLRYLEYCIEFSSKIADSDNENKSEYLNKLSNMFKENFDWIEMIEKQENNKQELKILELLKNVDTNNLNLAWEKLSNIYNEK